MPVRTEGGVAMLELSRILIAGGSVAASCGLIIYGMGASYWQPRSLELTSGLWLMIIGTIVTIVGGFMFRQAIADE